MQALTAAHFDVSRIDEYSDTVAQGKVISADPSGRALYGSTITVTVSKGPELVTIPDFPALSSVDTVESQLTGLGLHVQIEDKLDGKFGLVYSINPGSGEQVPIGSTVIVTVI